MSDKPLISIVAPVYNEAGSLPELHRRVAAVFAAALSGYEFELILVDDGSKDGSREAITGLCEADARVRGVFFSRNFGKELALSAGAAYLDPTAVAAVFLDSDLQHPPELIAELVARWQQGSEVVAGVRADAAGYPPVKRLASKLFCSMLRRSSDIEMAEGETDFRLLGANALAAFRLFPERKRMFRGIVNWLGFPRAYVTFEPQQRRHGSSSFPGVRLAAFAFDSFTSFSVAPIRLIGLCGVGLSALFVLVLAGLCAATLAFGTSVGALAWLLAAQGLALGVVLAALGLVGQYAGLIHAEAVGRPAYIVGGTAGFTETRPDSPQTAKEPST